MCEFGNTPCALVHLLILDAGLERTQKRIRSWASTDDTGPGAGRYVVVWEPDAVHLKLVCAVIHRTDLSQRQSLRRPLAASL